MRVVTASIGGSASARVNAVVHGNGNARPPVRFPGGRSGVHTRAANPKLRAATWSAGVLLFIVGGAAIGTLIGTEANPQPYVPVPPTTSTIRPDLAGLRPSPPSHPPSLRRPSREFDAAQPGTAKLLGGSRAALRKVASLPRSFRPGRPIVLNPARFSPLQLTEAPRYPIPPGGLDVRFLRPTPLGPVLSLRAVPEKVAESEIVVNAELVFDEEQRATLLARWLRLSSLIRGPEARGTGQLLAVARALFAGRAKLRLPGTVGMDDLPIAFCDVLGIEGGAGNDLAGNRQCRHPDAIRLQIGSRPSMVAADRSAALPREMVARAGIG